MRCTTVLPLPAIVVVVVMHAARRAAGAAAGDRSCERSCGSMKLPYPFGFSSGCTIRLGCNANGTAWLGDARELGLLVRNATRSGIILELATNCSRPFNSSVAALFSDNYAPASGNTLIVSLCSPAAHITNCSSEPPDRYMNRTSAHCSANDSIRCMLPGYGRPFLNRSEVLASECNGLVSSVNYADVPGPTLLMGKLGLDWWVQGQCRCTTSANCTQFVAPTTQQEAFRCECMDGFEGDGFIQGAGCHRLAYWPEGPSFSPKNKRLLHVCQGDELQSAVSCSESEDDIANADNF